MNFLRALLIFAVLMVFGLLGYRIAWGGLYPLVLVDYSVITGSEIASDLDVAYDYYQNALLYSGENPEKLDIPESYNELKRAVMDEAISREIILRELNSSVGMDEADKVVERKIEKSLFRSSKIEAGVETLYGLSLDEFKNKVLRPQAYREILEGRMNLGGRNFSSWLQNARAESRIIILSPDFSWDGKAVIINFN